MATARGARHGSNQQGHRQPGPCRHAQDLRGPRGHAQNLPRPATQPPQVRPRPNHRRPLFRSFVSQASPFSVCIMTVAPAVMRTDHNNVLRNKVRLRNMRKVPVVSTPCARILASRSPMILLHRFDFTYDNLTKRLRCGPWEVRECPLKFPSTSKGHHHPHGPSSENIKKYSSEPFSVISNPFGRS